MSHSRTVTAKNVFENQASVTSSRSVKNSPVENCFCIREHRRATRKTSDAYNSGDLSPRMTSPSHREDGVDGRGLHANYPAAVPMIYPSAPVRRQRLSVARRHSPQSRVDARLKPPYHELSSTTCWKVETTGLDCRCRSSYGVAHQIFTARTINFRGRCCIELVRQDSFFSKKPKKKKNKTESLVYQFFRNQRGT